MNIRKGRSEHGFTLMELLVAMSLSAIVMAAVYSAYNSQQKANENQNEICMIQQNLRAAMYYMEREIRMGGFDPEGTDQFGFTNVVSNPQGTVRFTGDDDENGILSGATEYVMYRRNGVNNTLERDDGGGFQSIATNISGLSFRFLDENGSATTTPESVRSVDITLTGSEGGHNRQLSCRVFCRNMGT